jgi:spore maturation protein CgeB
MVFRISESLAARNLLFVEKFPGSDKYFTPGKHFVEFSSPNDLAEKLLYFSKNLQEAETILSSGHERMSEIILNSIFWRELF